jgi:ADP-L-glycero-D-manno-heptose 6-epimerase
MIVVTGGAGFIGSALIARLNGRGVGDILVVDELGTDEKWKNLRNLSFADYVDKDDFLEMVLADKVPDEEQLRVQQVAGPVGDGCEGSVYLRFERGDVRGRLGRLR